MKSFPLCEELLELLILTLRSQKKTFFVACSDLSVIVAQTHSAFIDRIAGLGSTRLSIIDLKCFLGECDHDYVQELLSDAALRQAGYFRSGKVAKLVEKCRKQQGHLLSERENMALVGIISTQLLDHLFIRNFPPYPIHEPEDMKRSGTGK